MWRSKKFIIVVVLAAMILTGSIGWAAVAADNGDGTQSQTLLDRVAEILVGKGVNITSGQLEDAFTQARTEMRDKALDSRLQKLVDEGTITSDEATAYKEWLQAAPDMAPFRQQLRDWEQTRPQMPPEFKEWQNARPDVPFGFGFKGHGGFRMGGMRGFGGPCAPVE